MATSWKAPVYGWAMTFRTSSFPYTTQDNRIGGPPSPLTTTPCPQKQTDGRYVQQPPFYTLGPHTPLVCPYYNYVLPDAYPYDSYNTSPSPNPKQYWYFPYYRNDRYWENPLLRVPIARGEG